MLKDERTWWSKRETETETEIERANSSKNTTINIIIIAQLLILLKTQQLGFMVDYFKGKSFAEENFMV